MSNPMPGKPSDFVLRVEGLELNDGVRDRIAGALQASLMAELGRLDLAAKAPVVAFIPRKEWYGLWLRSLAQLRDFKSQEFEKVLDVGERAR